MTDNLPAAPREFGTLGQQSTPMAEAPSTALAFALGYACARPQHANTFGPFLAMCEELMTRPANAELGLAPTEWDQLMGLLPPPLARNIAMLYQTQRGMRWARTGTRHGRTPTDVGEQVDTPPAPGV